MLLDRTELKRIEDDFLDLLNQSLPEQKYQEFMEENTILIPREFVQNHGIHFDMVFRKIFLAKDYSPDFFYLSKSSADWNLVLIEIEKPQSRYFKDNSNDFHQDFINGMSQITRWRAWFDNRDNMQGFIGGTIAPVHIPESMRRNKCHIKYVLVHGRRSEFEGSELRRGLIRAIETDDFHIVSFDSLTEALHTKSPLYLCVRKNEHVEILTENFISETIFSWMDSSQLKITDELRNNILLNKDDWRYVSTKGGMMLDHKLPMIGRFDKRAKPTTN